MLAMLASKLERTSENQSTKTENRSKKRQT